MRNDWMYVDKPRRGGGGWLIIIALLLAAILATALMVNHATNGRAQLLTEKVSVMALDKAYEGFSVLHVSDLHAEALGSDAELWRELLHGKTFHAVVMSGDMVGQSGSFEPMLSLIHTLRQIRQDVPIYFISGDDDPTPLISAPHGTADVLADWVRAAQQMGAVYLDAPVSQTVGKKTVWFVPAHLYDVDVASMVSSLTAQKAEMEAQGRQYDAEGGASYRALCCRLDAMQRTMEAQKAMLSTDLQIAVNHSPLETEYIRSSLEWADRNAVFSFRNISLLLCGDTCGGQWRLPGVGPVYLPERGLLPGDAGVMGMQRINSINQYVSPGLGASDSHPLPGRLLNQPGVTILKFTAVLQ